jgi:hypothetical protein
VIVVGVLALGLPSVQPGAAQSAAVQELSAAWGADYETQMFQETWRQVSVSGPWWRHSSRKFRSRRGLDVDENLLGRSFIVKFTRLFDF